MRTYFSCGLLPDYATILNLHSGPRSRDIASSLVLLSLWLSLAHGFILANIVTGFYNKLLSYFVLFTFGHEVKHMRIAINRLNTGRQKRGTQKSYRDKNHIEFASYREKLRKHLLLATDTENKF